ncbi:MAG: carboxylating nicotinate-nucleotide diphosphorylase [Gammaproteobacteria bacterium]|nr:carboxylating nicotinate-nucleotide diphosphorylase [Gammaproteobacteria bacterium]
MLASPLKTSPPSDLDSVVRLALAEDIGEGDITAELIPEDLHVRASIIGREGAVLCGIPWANAVFSQIDQRISLNWLLSEGDEFARHDTLVTIEGPARAIMTGERTALNFLQTLSATATRTRQLVHLIAHTKVTLLDTRKTLPGLRSAQKYAVRAGGGSNHRLSLFDAFLIKENHIAACGGIIAAVNAARRLSPKIPVEIEVQDLEGLELALSVGADIIMLDNFDVQALSRAVCLNAGRAKLEASGGVDTETLVSIAETGVDYISVGALTKHCQAIDLSLLVT